MTHSQAREVSAYLHSLKTAIALNNAGVTLLDRNSCEDAVLVLHDALVLMRGAFPGSRAPSGEGAIHAALHRASDLLAQSLSSEEAIKQPKAMPLRVVADIEMPVFYSQNPNSEFAITIDENKYEEEVDSVDAEASIVLFNYGMACRCLHERRTSDMECLMSAFKFFHMAYGVLSKPFRPIIQHSESLTGLIVYTLVLQNLVLLSESLQMPDERFVYNRKLCEAREKFAMLQKVPLLQYNNTAPAA